MTRHRAASCLALCLLVGCASRLSSAPAAIDMPSRWTFGETPATTTGVDDPRDRAQPLNGGAAVGEDWWSDFGGPHVDALVRRALAANPNVTVASASLRQARELALAQSASMWPTLGAGLGAVQARGANASVINSGAPRSRTALLSASYSPDFFGANAGNLASTKAQEDAARWQFEAVRLTLEGAVLNALATEKGALRVEHLTLQLTDIDAATLAILKSRESLGDASTAMVLAQSQQLHDRRTQLAAARLQTAQARDLLAALLGDVPARFVEPDIEFDQLAPPDVAPGVPGDVISRRPDVQMAAAQFRAADAAHQAAIAGLLPQVLISGDAGYVATTARHLFDPASLVWDVAASATQTLFDAGAQRHRVAAALALGDAQSAQYRATLVDAFKDVADALEATGHDAEADADAIARAQAARRQFEIAAKSEALGQISHQDALAAQSQMLQMQLLQTQVRVSRLLDASNLLVALGGRLQPAGAPLFSKIATSDSKTSPQP